MNPSGSYEPVPERANARREANYVMPERFAIRLYSTDSDYPEWSEYQEYVGGDVPWRQLRFGTREEAEAYIDKMLTDDDARRRARWEAKVEANKPHREIFQKRKALLEERGLWVQPWENFSPFIVRGIEPEPEPSDRSAWRVVTERALDEYDATEGY